LVGKSTHSVEQAVAAEREGADYIGFGPIFSTPTKPDYSPIGLAQIREVHDRLSIPVFCIGGIKSENLAHVIAAGAERVVIVSGRLQANGIAGCGGACKRSWSQQRDHVPPHLRDVNPEARPCHVSLLTFPPPAAITSTG